MLLPGVASTRRYDQLMDYGLAPGVEILPQAALAVVPAGAAYKAVVSERTEQTIPATAAIEDVVAPQPPELVVAVSSAQNVPGRRSRQRVVPRGSHYVIGHNRLETRAEVEHEL